MLWSLKKEVRTYLAPDGSRCSHTVCAARGFQGKQGKLEIDDDWQGVRCRELRLDYEYIPYLYKLQCTYILIQLSARI